LFTFGVEFNNSTINISSRECVGESGGGKGDVAVGEPVADGLDLNNETKNSFGQNSFFHSALVLFFYNIIRARIVLVLGL
jgi:hypothetical protein